MMLPVDNVSWVRPGSRLLLQAFGEGLELERIGLWPQSSQVWIVHHPNDVTSFENLGTYEKVRNMSGKDRYPDDVDSVEAYQEMINDCAHPAGQTDGT